MASKRFALSGEEGEALNAIASLFKEQLTKCITELQLLDAETNDDEFVIGPQEDYTSYQQDFIMEFFKCLQIHEVTPEQAKKVMDGEISIEDFMKEVNETNE